jgi:coenzyme PQQ precursor peptide PqqA
MRTQPVPSRTSCVPPLNPRYHPASNSKENAMVWKTPRIIEITVGMEINTYACADL